MATLLGTHVVGQNQPLAEELDGTGGGDTGGADEQLEGLLERFIRRNEVEDLAAQILDLSVEVSDALVPASDKASAEPNHWADGSAPGRRAPDT